MMMATRPAVPRSTDSSSLFSDRQIVALQKKVRRPILLQGLPGVGNVGKIAVELIVEQRRLKPVLTFPTDRKPGLVLVQPNHLIAFPQMLLYHLRVKRQDFLLLTGDMQPASEEATYDLAASLVSLLEKLECPAIITLGGIGLQEPSDEHQVYVTGNDRALIAELKKAGANGSIHGVVGPIIGLSGIMLGVADKRIAAAALLAESTAHPFFADLRGAEQLLHLLDRKYHLKINLRELRESIDAAERLLEHGAPAGELPKKQDETSYIG